MMLIQAELDRFESLRRMQVVKRLSAAATAPAAVETTTTTTTAAAVAAAASTTTTTTTKTTATKGKYAPVVVTVEKNEKAVNMLQGVGERARISDEQCVRANL